MDLLRHERSSPEDPRSSYTNLTLQHPLTKPSTPESDGPGPFLEGGDDLSSWTMTSWIWQTPGLASNQAGIDWLRRYLGPQGYQVQEVPSRTYWLHLDCVLAIVRPGLAMAAKSAFKNGLPSL